LQMCISTAYLDRTERAKLHAGDGSYGKIRAVAPRRSKSTF
jgi:hypothetical protein